MSQTVRLADLRSLSASEFNQAIEQLAAAGLGPANGQSLATTARIRSFEAQYEISSARLLDELRAGSRKETAEISEWLFLLNLVLREQRGR